jgi:hypothetical protein
MVRCVSRFFVGAVLVSGLLLAPPEVSADQINFNGPALTRIVTLGGTNADNYHGSAHVGAYSWTWNGTPPEGFAQTFYSYCVDLSEFVTSTQQVTPQSSSDYVGTGYVANGIGRAAWLFNEYAAGIHAMTNTTTASIYSAGLQLAIWEALYDTTNNLAEGAFTATTSNTTVMSAARNYLSELYKSNLTGVATILNSNVATGQDQMVAQVDEPSTLLLMGLAFFGFAALARRRVVAG